MPYIRQEDRDRFDCLIASLAHCIDDHEKDGQLNYIISRLIDKKYQTKYRDLNAAIGVVECVKQELYRRVIAPYEDTKISENGDVYDRPQQVQRQTETPTTSTQSRSFGPTLHEVPSEDYRRQETVWQ